MASTQPRIVDKSESQLLAPDLNGERSITHISEAAPVSLLSIMDRAIAEKMAPESLEKLFALYERMEAGVARKAFFAAMAEFKRTCPPVPRRTENPQFKVTRNGAPGVRKFASLEDIGATVGPHLSANGLSYDWGDSIISENGKYLTISCIVSHTGGHEKSSSSTVPIESKAGCSEQQKVGSAESYAMRYSLIKALGLTTRDEDADGNDPEQAETITASQAADLEVECDELGVDPSRILTFATVDSFEQIPVSVWPKIREKMDAKRKAIKEGKK